jgi:hypothetical protein
VPHELLGEITVAAGGGADLAARVETANTARHAAELWDEAGLLEAAATELCTRVAEVLARFLAGAAETAAAGSRGSGPERAEAGGAGRAPGADAASGAGAPASVRVVMVDFSGRAQIATSPEVATPPAPPIPPAPPAGPGAPA